MITSCSKDGPDPDAADKVIIEAYLDSMGIDATLASTGIYHYLVAPGTDPGPGDVFHIQYELYELDGGLIDSVTSYTADTAIVLKHGVNAVYPVGVDLALDLMEAGETRGFIIPSSKAYGELDFPGISKGAILHMIITMVSVSTEEDMEVQEQKTIADYVTANLSGGNYPVSVLPQGFNMRYRTNRPGVTGTAVASGDTVSVTYTISTLDGRQIDAVGAATPFTFVVDGDGPKVMLGLNAGIKGMALNEQVTMILPSRAAYYYSVAVIPRYIIDENVISIEDNPLITGEVLPTYAARIRPYEVIRIDLELIGINGKAE